MTDFSCSKQAPITNRLIRKLQQDREDASDDELEALIDKTIPILEQHRELAQILMNKEQASGQAEREPWLNSRTGQDLKASGSVSPHVAWRTIRRGDRRRNSRRHPHDGIHDDLRERHGCGYDHASQGSRCVSCMGLKRWSRDRRRCWPGRFIQLGFSIVLGILFALFISRSTSTMAALFAGIAVGIAIWVAMDLYVLPYHEPDDGGADRAYAAGVLHRASPVWCRLSAMTPAFIRTFAKERAHKEADHAANTWRKLSRSDSEVVEW